MYLETISLYMSFIKDLDIEMAITFWQAFFWEFQDDVPEAPMHKANSLVTAPRGLTPRSLQRMVRTVVKLNNISIIFKITGVKNNNRIILSWMVDEEYTDANMPQVRP